MEARPVRQKRHIYMIMFKKRMVKMCYIHMESSKEFEGGNHTDCCERARLNRYSRESSSNDQRLW